MSPLNDSPAGFGGLRVVAFESRHAGAMERLIRGHGGEPEVVPALREVPLTENTAAFAFAEDLFAHRIDIVIFLTGVGTRALTRVIETQYSRAQWQAALSALIVVARGPKPVAALRELNVPIHITAPEPNTWRELIAALDRPREVFPLAGRRVAVQEYGISNNALLDALRSRGAEVLRVPVYQWALPEDVSALRRVIAMMAAGHADVVLFTTSVQLIHIMKLAEELRLDAALRQALARMVIASIGPTTSETLLEYGLAADLEPTHPKMAALVKEASERSHVLLSRKRGPAGPRDRV